MSIWSRILLFVKIRSNAALDAAEDPREVLDYAYREQQELLRKVQQGLIEVATSRTRLERQAEGLRGRVPQLEDQARRAVGAGREDLARAALQRKRAVLAELESLSRQAAEIGKEEGKLSAAQVQLAARVEEFRTRRISMDARYAAAGAQVAVGEALTGVSGELAELSMAVGRAEDRTERLQARASALGSLIDSGALAHPPGDGNEIERELLAIESDRAVEQELRMLIAGQAHDEIAARLEPLS